MTATTVASFAQVWAKALARDRQTQGRESLPTALIPGPFSPPFFRVLRSNYGVNAMILLFNFLVLGTIYEMSRASGSLYLVSMPDETARQVLGTFYAWKNGT
jgi:hypothetical protein